METSGGTPAAGNMVEARKEQPGIHAFAAYETVEAPNQLLHKSYHDLESAYWVLLTEILFQTQRTIDKDYCEVVFAYCDAAARKQRWLTLRNGGDVDDFSDGNNQHLTELMKDLNIVVMSQFDNEEYGPPVLMYRVVHAILDKALARTGWSAEQHIRLPRLYGALDTSMFEANAINHAGRKVSAWFVAYEVLRCASVIQEVQHDLESYFWTLLWVVFRHTHISLPADTWQSVFPYGDARTLRIAKRTWVGDDRDEEYEEQLVAIANEPLTSLLFDFRTLVRRNILGRNTWQLTYDIVLVLLDTALEKQGWPDHDWQEYTMPEAPEVSSLVAPQYDIPASEAPHARGRDVTVGGHSNRHQGFPAAYELAPSQLTCPPSMDHRYSVTGIKSYTESNKRALGEGLQDDQSVGQRACSRLKRLRIDTVPVDMLSDG